MGRGAFVHAAVFVDVRNVAVMLYFVRESSLWGRQEVSVGLENRGEQGMF